MRKFDTQRCIFFMRTTNTLIRLRGVWVFVGRACQKVCFLSLRFISLWFVTVYSVPCAARQISLPSDSRIWHDKLATIFSIMLSIDGLVLLLWFYCFSFALFRSYLKNVKRKVQGVPQSQTSFLRLVYTWKKIKHHPRNFTEILNAFVLFEIPQNWHQENTPI